MKKELDAKISKISEPEIAVSLNCIKVDSEIEILKHYTLGY